MAAWTFHDRSVTGVHKVIFLEIQLIISHNI